MGFFDGILVCIGIFSYGPPFLFIWQEFKHACALYVNKLIRLGHVNFEGVTLFKTYSIESLQPNKGSNWNFLR